MQPDEIIHLGNSVIQHGPANDRIYLMKLDPADLPGIAREIYELGRQNGYTKLFAKVPATAAPHFSELGFVDEARVPNMCRGDCSAYFMSKYLDQSRAVPRNIERISAVLDQADKKSDASFEQDGPDEIVRLRLGDAEALATLYSEVFRSYPFPVHDPAFLRKCMLADTAFFGIFAKDRLMAAASMEMDMDWRCAEMTDFATRPDYRGRGAAGRLLATMEEAMRDIGINVAYTIARAESYGMNIVFARAGYAFGGTLHNNTQIAGKLESMNVWHKQIVSRQGTDLPS
ncbi:putative beta-lysine N-acetyltransferase [Pseudodesulfovibrio cashew]|uniref:Putative beta-lysine N-acetyltransferase n=1 Tax=Pseudodesulfovibrio cashew TaxID=2678688 RepID=A0A6I6JE89_9BACT|nr:putative beta-lysine N-acetyltransferase [Pseudodesulfovibrio cashew]QGY38943.1 putative beta-lysine N-acetyltransferase [Pseudodesulfovibrio cashew]